MKMLSTILALFAAALASVSPAPEVSPRGKAATRNVAPMPALYRSAYRAEKPMIVHNQRQRRKLNRQVPQRLRNK